MSSTRVHPLWPLTEKGKEGEYIECTREQERNWLPPLLDPIRRRRILLFYKWSTGHKLNWIPVELIKCSASTRRYFSIVVHVTYEKSWNVLPWKGAFLHLPLLANQSGINCGAGRRAPPAAFNSYNLRHHGERSSSVSSRPQRLSADDHHHLLG